MKKMIMAAAVVAVAVAATSCKKEETAQPEKLKVKSIGDIKEHTGWDRDDSVGLGDDSGFGNGLMRTATPSSSPSSKKTKKAN